jgi:hypothetical protein
MGKNTTAARGYANTGQAVQAVMSGMRFLAGSDHVALTAAERADCLAGLEEADAVGTAARAGLLGAADRLGDFGVEGHRAVTGWLTSATKITRAEAAGHKKWVRRQAEHPVLVAAMRDGVLSRSWALKVMSLTGQIPAQDMRDSAELILVEAAKAGALIQDLVYLAAEILYRVAPPSEDKGYKDRYLQLQTTLDGAGVLTGALSPECVAAVQAILPELAKRAGKDDDRSYQERLHDALQEAMLRLLGSELAPKRNGHPVTAVVHVGLAELVDLDDGSVLMRSWTTRVAARWAAQRAAASVQPGDGAAWLSGPAAQGMLCDAALFPIVEGNVDLAHLDELVRLCVELDRYSHGGDRADGVDADGSTDAGGAGAGVAADRGAHEARLRELMEQIIGRAVALVSGQPGLAGFLRRNLLGYAGLGGPSLPLDVGDTDEIPWWIRRAVTTRDQACRWPGGCDQPAAACQPHHLEHRARHGRTALTNLNMLCYHHHHIAVHRDGWEVRACGDGTLEAIAPDGRVYKERTRPPPPRPG